MQTVSDAVRQLLDSYAKVTLAVYIDGEKLDVGVGAGSYTGACAGDDEFSFGNACAAGANIALAVPRPDLKGRRIQITWAVDGTEHPLITGQVEKAKVTAGRTEVEAWDDMYFAGSKAFTITSAVASTCTAAEAFTAVADAMGVSVETSALALLADITIPDGLSDLGSDVTNSAVAGYIAGLVGGNALMSRAGLLTIRQYAAVDWETEPYSGGAGAENEDFTVTGITLQREKTVSTLNGDGSTTERTSSEEYIAGDGSLMISNPLSSQAAADSAFAALSAVTIRPGNYSFPGGLLLEPGDIFTVHSMDGSYAVAVGSVSMSFDGGVRASVSCGGAAEGSSGIKGTINQALKALVTDYAKFKKLTADNAEINSAHILELIAGDIIANRIKAGIIKSVDGTYEIDLDDGTILFYSSPGNYIGQISSRDWGFIQHFQSPSATRDACIQVDDETSRITVGVGESTVASMSAKADGTGVVAADKVTARNAPTDATDATNKEYVDASVEVAKAHAKTVLSNPNLLDNWYFADPVNQRGQTEYTAEGFTLDRWSLALSTSTVNPSLTVGDGRIVLHNETATGTTCSCYIMQTIDNPGRFSGKTVTFSAKFKGVESASNAIIKIRSSGGNSSTKYVTVGHANSVVSVTMTLAENITSLNVCIGAMMSYGGDGSFDLEIESAKLEIGSVSTLANDAPPKYSEQLLECQRYYIRYASNGGQWLMGASNGSTLYAPLHLPVPMRAFPDAANGGFKYANVNIYPYVAGGKVEITNLTLTGASGTQDFILYAYHASGELAAKQPGCIRFTTGGYVELSAEI